MPFLLVACSVYTVPTDGPQPQGAAGAATSGGLPSVGGSDGAPSVAGASGAVTSGGKSALGTAGATASGGGEPQAGAEAELGGAAGGGGAGGADGSSGAPDAAGSGGAPDPSPTTFRYVKLVATSELNGKVWSSVAELQVMTTGGKALDRQGWSIQADSQELTTEAAPATNALDGDSATYWHTHWQWAANDDAPLPHWLIIDLGAAAPITGFSYLPRQNSANGRIKDWAFYVSNDGTNWGTPVKSGTFAAGAALQTIAF